MSRALPLPPLTALQEADDTVEAGQILGTADEPHLDENPISVAMIESTEGSLVMAPDSGIDAAARLRSQAHQAARFIISKPGATPEQYADIISRRLGVGSDEAFDILTSPETQAALMSLRSLVTISLSSSAVAAWQEEMDNLGAIAADDTVDTGVRVKAAGKRLDAAQAMIAAGGQPVAGSSSSSGPSTITVVGSYADYRSLSVGQLPEHPGQRKG